MQRQRSQPTSFSTVRCTSMTRFSQRETLNNCLRPYEERLVISNLTLASASEGATHQDQLAQCLPTTSALYVDQHVLYESARDAARNMPWLLRSGRCFCSRIQWRWGYSANAFSVELGSTLVLSRGATVGPFRCPIPCCPIQDPKHTS